MFWFWETSWMHCNLWMASAEEALRKQLSSFSRLFFLLAYELVASEVVTTGKGHPWTTLCMFSNEATQPLHNICFYYGRLLAFKRGFKHNNTSDLLFLPQTQKAAFKSSFSGIKKSLSKASFSVFATDCTAQRPLKQAQICVSRIMLFSAMRLLFLLISVYLILPFWYGQKYVPRRVFFPLPSGIMQV